MQQDVATEVSSTPYLGPQMSIKWKKKMIRKGLLEAWFLILYPPLGNLRQNG